MGLVPHYHNKVSITIKSTTQSFWFPIAYQSYVYAILKSDKCAIALCLKKISVWRSNVLERKTVY